MKVNPKRLQYAEISVLGGQIDGKTVTPLDIKKSEALEYPRPENRKDLKGFLGLEGWFRDFIKDFSNITRVVMDATKEKEWIWNEEMKLEFKNLKRVLKEMKQLVLPNYTKRFLLRTDASNVGRSCTNAGERDKSMDAYTIGV